MMMDVFVGRYPYLLSLVIFLIGLYGLLAKRNLVKKLIGMNIMQSGVILFFIVHAHKWGATVPVRDEGWGDLAANYVNPIPHALMLTAIVVSVATTGVALTMIRNIYRNFHSLEESDLVGKDLRRTP
jgi:multicomponent Na+:H+ antiporter subunit C